MDISDGHLMGEQLMGRHLIDGHLINEHLMGRCLMDGHLMSRYLIVSGKEGLYPAVAHFSLWR